jgi:UDP-N-acetylmuramyl pentapeptide phosphotransferase/UDP-N-acetylglucosamine-1-phosphate transferase
MDESQLINVTLVAALISFVVSLLIVCSERWHGNHSLDHDLNGVQKYHARAVPRVGGIAVITGVLGALVASFFIHHGRIGPVEVNGPMALLIASLPAFAAGIIEDLTKKVSVKARLLATIFSALAASALLGATIDEIDIWGIDALLRFAPVALVVTAVVVAGGANAINIIDGFNGLSGSVIVIMSAALGFLAWQAGDMFVATLAALGVGVALGFLMVNYPTGRLFLGDGGAYFLGFWVSEIAVLLLIRNPSVNAWQVLSVCAYPVIEVLYSIYRRKFIQKVNAGAPDAMHMHTLVYRRVAAKLVPASARCNWLRNAAVTCIITPWIGGVTAITVLAGGTIIKGLALVLTQVVLYVGIYGRLARRDQRQGQATASSVEANANAELS